jgi:hypothetical protein
MQQLFWVHEHKPDHGHPNSEHHDDDCADDKPASMETQREESAYRNLTVTDSS